MGRIDPVAYDAWYRTPFGALCHRLERDALFSLADFGFEDMVLDAGCGTGVYLEELVRVGIRPTGIDHDEAMLNLARAKGLGPMLVNGPIVPLPFGESVFDKVLSVCALEFAALPGDAVCEMGRVLRPGGLLIVGFLNSESPWARLRIEKAGDPSSVWHGASFFSIAGMTALAEGCGLRPKGYRGAVHFQPGLEGTSIDALERLNTEAMTRSPLSSAFIAAAFVK